MSAVRTVRTRPARLVALASAAVLGVVGVGFAAVPAWAATLTVTTTADEVLAPNDPCTDTGVVAVSSPVTLREALCVANNLGGSQVIDVPAGDYTLTQGAIAVGTQANADITISGTGGPEIIGNGATQLLTLDPGLVGDVAVTIEGVTFSGGVDTAFGGGAIIGGSGAPGAADSLTVVGSTFTGNSTGAGTGANPGGAIQFMGGTLTIEDSTFTGNTAGLSAGGAVYFEGMSAGDALSVSGSTFSGNTVTAAAGLPNGGGAIAYSVTSGTAAITLTGNTFDQNAATTADGAATPGGAVWQRAGAGTTTAAITGNTFTANASEGAAARGGAIDLASDAATVQFNRFHGNTGQAAVRSDASAAVTATENWWGCATGPGASPCDGAAIANGTAAPYLTLTAVASPDAVAMSGSSSLTASLLLDSAGGGVDAADLTAFEGLELGWSGAAPAGSLVDPATATFSNGIATASFTAGTAGGVGGANAVLDAASVTAAVTVMAPPAFTSATSATFQEGAAGSFTVTTTGAPVATISLASGSLPAGLVFTPSAGGQATIAGTPGIGAGGQYPLTLRADSGTVVTQGFTLIVSAVPVISSDLPATVSAGAAVDLGISATGFPVPAISVSSGTLPDGLELTDHGDGTAAITGEATAGSAGVHDFTISAASSAGTVSLPTSITVQLAPTITSADHATFTADAAGSFTVTADPGYPEAVLSVASGTLPSGVTFVPGAAGTATLSGTADTAGTYAFDIAATNAAGVDTQHFTLTVVEAPLVTTQPTSQTVAAGDTVTFTAAASGFPAPTVQWQRSTDGSTWTDVAGATAATLSFPAVVADDGNGYRAVFSNSVGSATSDAATLTTGVVPEFGTIPPVTVLPGAPRSIDVSVAGHPVPAITVVSGLPAWLAFVDNGDGTATLSGTPTLSDVGTSTIELTAVNSFGTADGRLSVAVTADVVPPVVLPTPDGVLGGVPAQVRPGQVITVSGDGFLPGAPIAFGMYSTPSTIGTATADASGAFAASVTIPADAQPGAHTIVATGVGAAGTARLLAADTTVVAPATPPGGGGSAASGSLSATGFDPFGWMLLAGLVLAGGLVLMRRTRRI